MKNRGNSRSYGTCSVTAASMDDRAIGLAVFVQGCYKRAGDFAGDPGLQKALPMSCWKKGNVLQRRTTCPFVLIWIIMAESILEKRGE